MIDKQEVRRLLDAADENWGEILSWEQLTPTLMKWEVRDASFFGDLEVLDVQDIDKNHFAVFGRPWGDCEEDSWFFIKLPSEYAASAA